MEIDFFSDNAPQLGGEIIIEEEEQRMKGSAINKVSVVGAGRKFTASSVAAHVGPGPGAGTGTRIVGLRRPVAADQPATPSFRKFTSYPALKLITASGEQRVITVRTSAPPAANVQQLQKRSQHIQLVQQSAADIAGNRNNATVQNLIIKQQPQQMVVSTAPGASAGALLMPPGMVLARQSTVRASAPSSVPVQSQRQLPNAAVASVNVKPWQVSGGRNNAPSYEVAAASGRRFAVPVAPPQASPPSSEDEGDGGPSDPDGLVRGPNGLRKYSRSVLEMVKTKRTTSFNEVADQLVQEYAAEYPSLPHDQLVYHQKNIRRRVYDALNVLMAMGIFAKDKKEIRWVGLPLNYLLECENLERERAERLARIQTRMQEVQEHILQLITVKNLIARNKTNEQLCGVPVNNQRIELPYLIVLTNKQTVIDCNISNDRMQHLFNFNQAFKICDHVETLKRLGLCLNLDNGTASEEEFSQSYEQVPLSLRFYVEAMYERRPPITPDFEGVHAQRKMVLEQRLVAAASGGYHLADVEMSDGSDMLDVG